MQHKHIKKIVYAGIFFAAIIGFGWLTIDCLTGCQVVDYDYSKDYQGMQEIFKRDWDWLIPVGPDQYSLDLVLKYRAPQQNPLYAGRLKLKVMRDGDKLIGFVGYYMKNDQEGFFNFLDVNPAYRGKGYAEKLANYAINDMISKGARRITLVTYPHNFRALKLYHRLGFKEIKKGVQVELEYIPN
jgi:ribosomal protein S18 acetylase RimI-like enzyme